MHDRILAVEHPMIRVGPLDPHAGFVAGDNPGLAKNRFRLIGLDLEPRMGADEHVHQRAFADDQAKGVAEHEAQTLVGKRLKTCNYPGSLSGSREAQGFGEVFGIACEGFDDFPALLFGGREEGADGREVAGALL